MFTQPEFETCNNALYRTVLKKKSRHHVHLRRRVRQVKQPVRDLFVGTATGASEVVFS